MNPHKRTTIGLLIALLCFAPGEWGRVKDWFLGLPDFWQLLLGSALVLFFMIVLAWVLGPYAHKLLQHFIIQ